MKKTRFSETKIVNLLGGGLPTPTETPTATLTETPEYTLTPNATPTTVPSGPVTIDYTYDPLYRLTAADYDSGDYYHYTYDAVGNRLTQESSVGGPPSTVAYAYDIANRLTSVDGVTYTWDDNTPVGHRRQSAQ